MPMNFLPREIRDVIAPDVMTGFRCIAERCAWNCCRTWRIPVDPVHAAAFRDWVDSDGSRPMDGFLKSIRSKRGKSVSETFYFDLASTPNQRCKFLDSDSRCTIQLRFGADALGDTCALFPRRLFQIDDTTFMTVSLSCPETVRELVLTERPLTLSLQRSPVDSDVEAIDTALIPDDSLRELLQHRSEFLDGCFEILYDRTIPLSGRIRKLCAHPVGTPGSAKNIAMRKIDDLSIGHAILAIQNSLLPRFAPFQETTQAAVHDLFGANGAYERALGAAFRRIDERFITPFFRERPYIFENYVANILCADALTEFARYQRPETTVAGVCAFLAARLVCAVNLFLLRLAAAVNRANAINDEIIQCVLMENDRNFWMSPLLVENAIDRFSAKITANEPIFLGKFLNESG